MTRKPTGGIGERELALMQWLAGRGKASVGEAAEGFGGTEGLARSTVQTMLERLHAKGYVRRLRESGRYRYAPAVAAGELLRGLVRSFIEGPLGGSLSPFVAYLAEKEEMSREELEELEELVSQLHERRRGEP